MRIEHEIKKAYPGNTGRDSNFPREELYSEETRDKIVKELIKRRVYVDRGICDLNPEKDKKGENAFVLRSNTLDIEVTWPIILGSGNIKEGIEAVVVLYTDSPKDAKKMVAIQKAFDTIYNKIFSKYFKPRPSKKPKLLDLSPEEIARIEKEKGHGSSL